ncbi:hypothetical protein FZEAL_6534 [Fusarium zealandicum]|uniref:hydroxymethylglutaryl-CoA lyase n=1 Tax=Fusarium zealandicum TaxID=1053134 RepID=A0A8H4XJS6_9HYPO|nr:hypothetical protein FZEAL_6534 [Fusarium zealandicum]
MDRVGAQTTTLQIRESKQMETVAPVSDQDIKGWVAMSSSGLPELTSTSGLRGHGRGPRHRLLGHEAERTLASHHHGTSSHFEVGPRDGLQNVRAVVPASVKLALIQKLRYAGLNSIAVTSFVSPKAVPRLSDCRKVMSSPLVRGWLQMPGPQLRLPALVPNIKGLKVALENGIQEVAVFVSATEGFSRANINCSVAEGIERAKAVAAEATGHGLAVRG